MTCLLTEKWNLILLDIFSPFQVLFKFRVAAFLYFSNWRLWRGGHLICTIRTYGFLFCWCSFIWNWFIDVNIFRWKIMDYVMYVILKCCWYWENDMILYMDEWGYFEDSLQVGMAKLQRTLCQNLRLNLGWGVSMIV